MQSLQVGIYFPGEYLQGVIPILETLFELGFVAPYLCQETLFAIAILAIIGASSKEIASPGSVFSSLSAGVIDRFAVKILKL